MSFRSDTVSIEKLLLDPNNYRFLDLDDYVKVVANRIHEESVQNRSVDLIKKDGRDELRALKESIEINGYINIEALVLKPYEHNPDLFVVVEGNRRVAAMKWLKNDREAGSEIPMTLIESFNSISAIILDTTDENYDQIQHILIGVRHVSGIKQWGGYQRAKLLVELVEENGFSVSEAAQRIGMSPNEALRRFRAFKALEQLANDDEFGSYTDPKMYRLFHEAVSVVKIKEWLGWDESEFKFTNEEELKKYYKLLIPIFPEDDDEPARSEPPKIKTYQDVRNLREILGNEDAETSLYNPNQSYSEALAIAKATRGPVWLPKIKSAIQALDNLPTNALKNLTAEESELLIKMYSKAKERLDDWKTLTGNEWEQ